jgi:glycosyltransferase involved in cell wall biosynthesis
MRIAICTDQYLPMVSGLVDSVDILAKQLRKNGHEVRIYAPNLPGSMPDDAVYRFKSFAIPGSGGTMIVNFPIGAMRDIKRFRPDVVHTHLFGVAGFFAWRAARKLGVPFVATDHTFPADYLHYLKLNWGPFPYLVRRFASWFHNRADFVTIPSENLKKELVGYGLKRPTKIISNHVPADIFRPLFKEECKEKLGVQGPAVLVFGRIAKEKSLEVTLEVFKETLAHMRAQLLFVGDGPYRLEVEKKVKEMSLELHARFLGVLRGEELVEAVNAGDVFLMTSTSENQPMSMLQAMSCGLPVVVANAGGPPEYVEEGKNGYVVEPKDVKTFAHRIISILENPESALSMGERGRIISAKFSPESITAQFEEVYRSLIT